jgi:hypothetical protein
MVVRVRPAPWRSVPTSPFPSPRDRRVSPPGALVAALGLALRTCSFVLAGLGIDSGKRPGIGNHPHLRRELVGHDLAARVRQLDVKGGVAGGGLVDLGDVDAAALGR